MPERDLLVSPQHRLLLISPVVRRMFGSDEVLISARHMLAYPRVTGDTPSQSVTYVHFMCDRHKTGFADKMATKKPLPGRVALKSPGAVVPMELIALFPNILQECDAPITARHRVGSGRLNSLVARSDRNDLPLESAAPS